MPMTEEEAKRKAADLAEVLRGDVVVNYETEAYPQENGKYTINGNVRLHQSGIDRIAAALIEASKVRVTQREAPPFNFDDES